MNSMAAKFMRGMMVVVKALLGVKMGMYCGTLLKSVLENPSLKRTFIEYLAYSLAADTSSLTSDATAVPEKSRTVTKVQEGSGRFRKVQKGSGRFR